MRTEGLPNTAALGRAVADGGLWIEPLLVADGAHERCAAAYERLAAAVDAQIRELSSVAVLPGFGSLASGVALRTGFEGKAAQSVAQLTAYAAAARDLAAVLRAAAVSYREVDASGADALVRLAGDEHA
ncbi:hypothetical protein [Nocardia camponoti]|nr:hypothetical protein [Nocardia camponoti]